MFASYHDLRCNTEADHNVPILNLPLVFVAEVQKFDRATASHESGPEAVQTRPRRRHEAGESRHSMSSTDETQPSVRCEYSVSFREQQHNVAGRQEVEHVVRHETIESTI